MAEHSLSFPDRLARAISEKKTPLIVNLDPVFDQLPEAIRSAAATDQATDAEAAVDAILAFSKRIIKIVAPHVPAVKINIAYFEAYLSDGLEVYGSLVQEAAAHGLLVIGDVKRGDVGHTAQRYAQATLANPTMDGLESNLNPDAVTVNPYLGRDGIEPFLEIAQREHKGLFVLVRTSNPSGGEVQGIVAADGRPVYLHVADLVETWGRATRGASGYSAVGAVVGGTHAADMTRLRDAMPHTIFLVPGYGAQGATAADVAHAFKPDGTGAIVGAGRSIIFAYNQPRYKAKGGAWEGAVESALMEARTDLARALQQ